MKSKKIAWMTVVWFAVTVTLAAVAQDDNPGAPPPNGDSQSQSGAAPDSRAWPQSNNTQESNQESNAEQESNVAARVSLIHGDVSMQRSDTGEWTAATINTPLVRGDQLATGDRSRAEIQLDFANVLRLASKSQAKVADLTRKRVQVQVSQGYANYSVFKGNEADIEIDTPNVAVHPLQVGRYRVQVNSDSETVVIVRAGEAQVSTAEGSTTVKEGQLITVRGTESPEYQVADAPPRDDWDNWNRDRDSSIREADSWRRTNRYYTGSNDLDSYGRWVNAPGYGDVWQPDQGPDWAPYREGRWVWEPYWGWTWVSYEPWGWAPYHYGRWFWWNTGWVWWPGPIQPYYRPIWSPAFVFFFGFGPHVGFGFNSIGWCPVGPFDPFFPWWGRGFGRVNVVNITNINVVNVRHFNGRVIAPLGVRGRQPVFSNANMIMTNARVRAGVTSVASSDFGRGIASSRSFGVNQAQLHEAHVMTANVPVVPTHESLQPGRNGAGTGMASVRPNNSSHFFTRNAPPSSPPAFHEQAARMQQVMQDSARNGASPSGNARSGAEVAGHGESASTRTEVGQRSTGTGQANMGNVRSNAAEEHGGWHSFGGGNSAPSGAGAGPSGRSMNTMDRGTAERNDRPGWTNLHGTNSEGTSGRRELQMEKPIVTPRGSEGNQSPRYGMPSNQRPQINNSQPSHVPEMRSPHDSSGVPNRGSGSYGGGPYGPNRGSGPYGNGGYGGGRGPSPYGGGGYGSSRGSGPYANGGYGGGHGPSPYGGGGYGSSRGSGPYGGVGSYSHGSGSYGGHSSGSYGGGHSSGGSDGHSSGGGHNGGSSSGSGKSH